MMCKETIDFVVYFVNIFLFVIMILYQLCYNLFFANFDNLLCFISVEFDIFSERLFIFIEHFIE